MLLVVYTQTEQKLYFGLYCVALVTTRLKYILFLRLVASSRAASKLVTLEAWWTTYSRLSSIGQEGGWGFYYLRAATKCFILLAKEATIWVRPLYKSGLWSSIYGFSLDPRPLFLDERAWYRLFAHAPHNPQKLGTSNWIEVRLWRFLARVIAF